MSRSLATHQRSEGALTTAVERDEGPRVLRGIVAAAVLLSADIHLVLWLDSFADIPVIGPLFLVNVVAGLLIGVGMLIVRHWFLTFLAAGFGAATFAAYLISRTVGLFGVREQTWDPQAVLAAVAEIVAALGGVVLLAAQLRSRRARGESAPT
ncbi:hypothetical protein [Microlunatus speluncae]|uniref:hypothetical protein n=1 Tax=Microlunatus speluncae TaxID=2594267 RepID=UPI0012666DCD|nr:hypothetical protein [Microlunatus speluncae]